jgi:inner membrane protein
VDNLTHSLVGAALSELTLPPAASRGTRRTFFIAGVVAANLPDADLVYTRITAAPLGALLHHRGHTHTVVGIVLLGLAMAAVCALPRVRDSIGPSRARLWLLIALGLTSHLVLDSWNSYGVHPFWPVTGRWYYGDAVYILEPWLWVLLGAAAAINAWSRATRLLLILLLAALTLAATWMRVIPLVALGALVVAVAAFVVLSRRWAPPRRSAVSLALCAVYVAALFGVREVVRAEVTSTPPTSAYRRSVDLVLSPEPANPLCWSVLAIESDEAADAYAMTRGTATVLARGACGSMRAHAVEWDAPSVQPLSRLRGLYAGDCWVRAWLQFGRAPAIGDGRIGDLRYGGEGQRNFTSMPIGPRPGGECPAYLTSWRPPRADLLDASMP